MFHFKVGTSFDMSVIDKVKELNEKYAGRSVVTEFYGSLRSDAQFAARPNFRLPDLYDDHFIEFVNAAHDIGVKVNYTLNSIMPFGSKRAFVNSKYRTLDLLGFFDANDVDLITVGSPILLEMIKQYYPDHKFDIEVSTIMHVDTLTQIKYLHDMYGVKKVCGNLMKNRDFEFTKRASDLCRSLGIQYELMVNEFCGVGTSEYATHCIYRDSCYICHSTNVNESDANSFNNYPMGLCTAGRNANPANWLRSNFIRPEDLGLYEEFTGVDRFKITGRTGSADYQMRTLEAYMSGSFDGDLLELWKPLETIKQVNVSDSVDYKIIPNKKLDGFIKPFANGRVCANEVCGTTCDYCQRFYNKAMEG